MAISTEDLSGNAPVSSDPDIDADADVSILTDSAPDQDGAHVGTYSEDGAALPEADPASGNTKLDPEGEIVASEDALPVEMDAADGTDKVKPSDADASDGRSFWEAAVSEGLKSEDSSGQMVSERSEEVPALLSEEDHEDSDIEAVVAQSGGNAVEGSEDKQQSPAIIEETANIAGKFSEVGSELKVISESLQNSLEHIQSVSSKIDAVSNDTDSLKNQVGNISSICELLTSEMESVSSGANTKSILSKTFLTISSLIVLLLVVFQVYMFVSLVKIQRLQNVTGSSVLESVSVLSKKMADYDNNLTKALATPAQQNHAQANVASMGPAGHDIPGNNEIASANTVPALEKLNKLRNGLQEKKLIRKETGDWFVYNKKTEECISDVEVIGALNEAYKKIGRSLTTTIPMPSHKALCILKPDGKGGTEVVMAKDFLP